MNGADLVDELSSHRSRFWSLMTPQALAAWVLDDESDPAAFEDLPPAVGLLPVFEKAFETSGAADPRDVALGLMGFVVRDTVPAAAASAGKHWLVTTNSQRVWQRIRLTVGMCWAAQVFWTSEEDFQVDVRVAASPIDEALANGTLSTKDMQAYGVIRRPSTLMTFADDAADFTCPDTETFQWFLGQPAVLRAMKLMNARLVSTGLFAFAAAYRPDLVADMWAASEALALAHAEPVAEPENRAAYAGRERTGDFPEWQATNPEAHERARDEHDRLTRLLVDRLTEAGVEPYPPKDPRIDLAWHLPGGRCVIAEVKSTFGPTEADRLRLGLGQVLDYRHRISDRYERVDALLVVSDVDDPVWFDICSAAGVRLLAANRSDEWALTA